jgi:hypothetical protein
VTAIEKSLNFLRASKKEANCGFRNSQVIRIEEVSLFFVQQFFCKDFAISSKEEEKNLQQTTKETCILHFILFLGKK